jgi:N-formylmaleamate deformylase
MSMVGRVTTRAVGDMRRAPRSRWFASSGLALRALEFAGDRHPIVVVPGITSPAATWTFVVDALNPSRHVILLDARGRGASDKPQTGYSTKDYVGDLKALIDAFRLKETILLGHSMGARVVTAFDVAFPAAAKALLVVDPPVSGPGRRPYPMPVDFYVVQRNQVLSGASVDELAREAPTWSSDRIQDRIDWLPSCSEAAIRQSHASFHTESFLENWSKVTAPALFVRGAKSPVIEQAEFLEVRAANPRATYVEIQRSGHMVPWDNLVDFVEVVERYVDDLNENDRSDRHATTHEIN